MTFKPMLAGKCEDMADLKYPVMVSNKLDGVRALVIGGVVMSRSLKPIPNAWVQRAFGSLPEGTDGELIFGDPTHPEAYRNTVSAVMSEDGAWGGNFKQSVNYHVFDNFNLAEAWGFASRFQYVESSSQYRNIPNVVVVPHTIVKSAELLDAMEQVAVSSGHEGVMVRSLDGPYKQGRSTAREGWLLKIKRFEDAEAVVISTYEFEHNMNEATTNALGHTARSSHQENKVGAGVLGGLNVTGLNGTYKGIDFSIGTGFSGAANPDGERAKLWLIRHRLPGRVAKFKYFASGSKDKPRFPVFLGWRDVERDM